LFCAPIGLGIAIGARASHVGKERALEHVAGYVVVDDPSERPFQLQRGIAWDRNEVCQTFGAVNPRMSVNRMEATHLLSVQATLGEGPVWDARSGVLWFVDILAPAIHRFDPQTGDHASWAAPAKVGCVVPAGGEELIAGLSDGLYRFSPADGRFALLQPVEPDMPGNRINDGAIDPRGNIWFGTMDDSEQAATGRFYRFDGKSVVDAGIPPVCITNGPAISPDGRTLYAVDTLARRISAYAIGDDMALGPARPFATLEGGDAYPDGVTCDAEGGVWLGIWGGWAARRYDASGAVTDEVRFPAANVTKIAIGGRDGRTAYATTARKGLDDRQLAGQPLAGDLFAFPVRIPGFATPVDQGRPKLPNGHEQSP
jgi:sugar lactone lactonase YvrE